MPINIAIIKIKYVVLPVVKKLPVLFIGKISVTNKKIKGIIKLFLLSSEFEKYFLYKVRYNIEENINKMMKNPTKPVSVKISK